MADDVEQFTRNDERTSYGNKNKYGEHEMGNSNNFSNSHGGNNANEFNGKH